MNNIHHPVTIQPPIIDEDEDITTESLEEDEHDHDHLHPVISHFKDDTRDHYADENDNDNMEDEDYNNDTDFYIIKAKRKRKHRPNRKPQLNDFEDYLDYSEVKDIVSGFSSRDQQHQEDLRDIDLNGSKEFLEPSSSEVRAIRNQKFLEPYESHIRSMRKERENKKRSRKGRHRQGRQQRHHSRRKLKGATAATTIDDGAIEGDVFQYEDFDIDISRPEHQYGDVSYEDQLEDDNGNSSNFSPSKERATPEHLVPKHRRIYSKWSRWTKCSPKCTTRRYK